MHYSSQIERLDARPITVEAVTLDEEVRLSDDDALRWSFYFLKRILSNLHV